MGTGRWSPEPEGFIIELTLSCRPIRHLLIQATWRARTLIGNP
jgi:hypothetical protein